MRRERRARRADRAGFALLPVVLALALLAATAYLMTRESALGGSLVSATQSQDRARYLAEAALRHADWQVQDASCNGFSDVPATSLGGGSYGATVTPTGGSPVVVAATGTLADGTSHTLHRSGLRAYEATPQTLVLQPGAAEGKDVWYAASKPTWNYGAADVIKAQQNAGQRSLIEFDLGNVPPGVRVVAATVELYADRVQSPGTVNLYRVTSPWLEGTCQGSGCSADGATWTTRDGVAPWTTPGGDHDPAGVTQTVSTVGWVAWDVTGFVSAWLAGTPNDGLLLEGPAPVDPDFVSSDAADASRHPKLTITYACECGQICGTGAGAEKLLLVVGDAAKPSSKDSDRQALMESWGHTVTLIDDGDSQKSFDAAVAATDVVYVTASVVGGTLADKLTGSNTGIVNEFAGKLDNFGFSSATTYTFTADTFTSSAAAHHISSPFGGGAIDALTTFLTMPIPGGTLAPGLEVPARFTGFERGVVTLDVGAARWDAAPAPARRVHLPFGPAEITQLTTDGQTIMRRAIEWAAGQTLIGHWMLDDAVGNLATDSSGKGNDGTLSDDPAWTTGTLAGALDFDGNDGVLVPDAPSLDITEAITLAAWVKPNATGTEYVIRKALFDSTDGYELSLSTTGKVFFRLNQAKDADTYRIDSTTSYPTDGTTWMHIAATYDGAVMRLYIDGAEEATLGAAISIATNDTDLSIGAQVDGTRGINGVIDDVRLYGEALGAARISDLAAAGGGGSSNHVLLVVGNASAPTAGDSDRIKRMGDWGFAVELIDDSDSKESFATAIAAAKVLYIGASTNAATLSGKVESHSIGIVSENASMIDDLGFALGAGVASGTQMTVMDRTHYVMAGFGPSTVTLLNSSLFMTVASSTLAPDLLQLGKLAAFGTGTSLLVVALEADALNVQGRSTPGRRIHLPLSPAAGADLTADGATLIRRAIVWGAGQEPPPGSGVVFQEFTEGRQQIGVSAGFSIPKPSGTAVGDLLIAAVATDGNTVSTLSPSASWNLAVLDLGNASGEVTFGVWWKIADGTEPSKLIYSWTGGEQAYGWIMRFTGHDPSSPLATSSVTTGNDGNPLSTNLITSTDGNLILRLGGFDDDDITVDAPGLFDHTAITMDRSNTGNQNTVSGGAGYIMQPVAGDTGSASFNLTAKEQYRAATIAIRPAQ